MDGCIVAYALAIYLLNLFLAFLSPKFDPSSDALDNEMEDGSVGALPTRQDEEFRPFIRRLPEFKFWYWATRAICIGFFCSWFEIFNIPVFWPVLLVYWIMLFFLTSKSPLRCLCRPPMVADADSYPSHSATADSAHDQVPLRALLLRQEELRQEQLLVCCRRPAQGHDSLSKIGDIECKTRQYLAETGLLYM
jgi:hypothetical protein